MGKGHEYQKPSSPNEILRQARLQRKWTQQDLADEVGTTIANVSRWERGITVPGPYFRRQLCARLDLQPEVIAAPQAIILEEPMFWHVPFCRNPFFTGRQGVLAQLHKRWNDDAPASHFPVYALSGLGGVGKTQTAIEYAYQSRQRYQAILWVPAERYEMIISEMAKFAELLPLSEKNEHNQCRLAQAAMQWFREQQRWLLIFDNVVDISLINELLPPAHQGHILLTTRSQSTGACVQSIDLPPLNNQDSMLFLLRRAKLVARDAALSDIPTTLQEPASALAELMAGLPLALDQVGAYIEETGCGLADYLDRYQHHCAGMLNRRGNPVITHPESVHATFSLCLKAAETAHPAIVDLLRLSACLAPKGIPEEILQAGISSAERDVSPDPPLLLDEILGILRRYSLIQRDQKTKTAEIHRLVQSVVQQNMEPSQRQQWGERAIQIINQAFPDAESVSAWPLCERYLAHALACIDLAEQQEMAMPEAGQLARRVGKYLRERALYAQAAHVLQMALKIHLRSGDDHLSVAETLFDLSWCYKDQGRFAEAELPLQRALAVFKQRVGPHHPLVADCLNNLAMTFRELGRVAEAIPLLQQAAAIWEHHDSQVNCLPNVLNNLGVVYHDAGNVEQAESLFQRALWLYDHQEHPSPHRLARALMNFGALYRDLGRYGEAEGLLRRALALREEHMGAEHPDTASSLHALASLYLHKRALHLAEPLYQRALTIREQVLGREHPHAAATLHDLALLRQQQGRLTQAASYYQRALDIQKRTLGAVHHKTLMTAACYAALQRHHMVPTNSDPA